jgi:hypothetical protein
MAQRIATSLLVLAWGLFAISLCLPAFDGTHFLIFVSGGLGFVPVGVLVVASAFSVRLLLVGLMTPYLLVLPGLAAFIVTPKLLRRSGDDLREIVRRLVAFALLSPWSFPIAAAWFLSPAQLSRYECGSILWGYYVFALAHTVAFVAVQIGSPIPAKS